MAAIESRNPGVSQPNLHQQDLSKLDITKLTALSPEVISRQATINIGTIGHVAHGKSTVVKAISGVQTVRFKNELERNITIKLERLPEYVLNFYRDRAEEKMEISFLSMNKIIEGKRKRTDSMSSNEEPPNKKHHSNNNESKSKKKSKSEVYIIEQIVDQKVCDGKQLFYVRWRGWSDDHNTWEPLEHLDNCPLILSNFLSEQEEKYVGQLIKLKRELSFGGLLDETKLASLLKVVDISKIIEIKRQLLCDLLSILTLNPKEESICSELVQSARANLQTYTFIRLRSKQLMALRSWEEHINLIDESRKLRVINEADLEQPPKEFVYINQRVPGLGVTIPEEPPIGCECDTCNTRATNCCGIQGGLFAYTAKRRLRVALGTPIYECNKACRCSRDCYNRVVQQGRTVRLCIFRTENGCGWGVLAEQKIFQGQFVCQYVGEVIKFDEAEKRGKEYDEVGLTYLFDLDFNSAEELFVVDAASMGNVSHFINHSCDPNLAVWAVWGDCLDPNLPMLALFATRDIEPGEQLCFDYLQKTNEENSIETENKITVIEKEVDGEIVPIIENDEVYDIDTKLTDTSVHQNGTCEETFSNEKETESEKTHIKNEKECQYLSSPKNNTSEEKSPFKNRYESNELIEKLIDLETSVQQNGTCEEHSSDEKETSPGTNSPQNVMGEETFYNEKKTALEKTPLKNEKESQYSSTQKKNEMSSRKKNTSEAKSPFKNRYESNEPMQRKKPPMLCKCGTSKCRRYLF